MNALNRNTRIIRHSCCCHYILMVVAAKDLKFTRLNDRDLFCLSFQDDLVSVKIDALLKLSKA